MHGGISSMQIGHMFCYSWRPADTARPQTVSIRLPPWADHSKRAAREADDRQFTRSLSAHGQEWQIVIIASREQRAGVLSPGKWIAIKTEKPNNDIMDMLCRSMLDCGYASLHQCGSLSRKSTHEFPQWCYRQIRLIVDSPAHPLVPEIFRDGILRQMVTDCKAT